MLYVIRFKVELKVEVEVFFCFSPKVFFKRVKLEKNYQDVLQHAAAAESRRGRNVRNPEIVVQTCDQ